MAESGGAVRRAGRGVARAATAPVRSYVNRQLEKMDESWRDRLNLVQDWLLGDIEAASELTSTHARSLTLLNQRLDQLSERLDQLSRPLDQLPEPVASAVRLRPETEVLGDAGDARAPRRT